MLGRPAPRPSRNRIPSSREVLLELLMTRCCPWTSVPELPGVGRGATYAPPSLRWPTTGTRRSLARRERASRCRPWLRGPWSYPHRRRLLGVPIQLLLIPLRRPYAVGRDRPGHRRVLTRWPIGQCPGSGDQVIKHDPSCAGHRVGLTDSGRGVEDVDDVNQTKADNRCPSEQPDRGDEDLAACVRRSSRRLLLETPSGSPDEHRVDQHGRHQLSRPPPGLADEQRSEGDRPLIVPGSGI